MQERKNKQLFILAVVLIITTGVVFWLIQRDGYTDIHHPVLDVADFTTIDRIIMESDSGKVALQYDGTRWRVNDRYNANGDLINVLFATLQQARSKRSVSHAQKDSVIRRTVESGVKVSLLQGEGLREEFYAGGNAAKTQAYFLKPSSAEAYVMSIPGYRVYVSGIFEMDENGWRDKTVFGFNWRNFRSLEARFPKTPAEDFVVSLNNGFVGIRGIETDTLKLNAFFDNLFSLKVDDYVRLATVKDSLDRRDPLADFIVTDVGNRTYRLKIFAAEKQTTVLGIIQDSEVGIFDRRKIQSLLRPKSFFIKK